MSYGDRVRRLRPVQVTGRAAHPRACAWGVLAFRVRIDRRARARVDKIGGLDVWLLNTFGLT